MKLSERIERHAKRFQDKYVPHDLRYDNSGEDLLPAIKELERKAALWDKLVALPDKTSIQYPWAYSKFSIRCSAFEGITQPNKYFGNTLEEALNQIPGVKA